jgi:hypothetical protein
MSREQAPPGTEGVCLNPQVAYLRKRRAGRAVGSIGLLYGMYWLGLRGARKAHTV